MFWNRLWMLCVLSLSACVVDNRSASEGEGEASAVDAGVESDGSQQAEVDMAMQAPESCMDEDDLYALTPSAIEVGFSRNDLFLCPDTTDTFELTGEPDQEVLIKLLADPVQNDLDLTVLDTEGNILENSTEETGEERIVFRFSEAMLTVRIEVTGYRDIESAYYLGVTSRCSSDRDCPDGTRCIREVGTCEAEGVVECGLDEFEPNNRENQASVVDELPANIEANLCKDDVDWFELSVNRGDIINVLVSFPGGVDIDLEVLKAADGAKVAEATGDARSNPERLVLSHLEEGNYLLGVRRYLSEDETDGDITYALELAGRSGGCASSEECLTSGLPICDDGICVEAATSAPLGSVCGRDADCAEGADVCYEGAAGGQDNICTVYCEEGSECDALGQGAYCQPISFQAAVCVPACTDDVQCGAFYVCNDGVCDVDGECRVDGDCSDGRICRTAQNGQRYCSRPTPEAACGLDADLEPNNRFSNAPALPFNERVQDLRTCNEDEDYFSFIVPEGMGPWMLSLSVTFRAGTDIDIYAYDAVGNLLGQATSPDQTTEEISIPFLAAGEIFLRVDQYDSNQLADTVYSVLATLEEGGQSCTVAGEECAETDPLRLICNEASGACESLEGAGQVGLGESCDSDDDCVDSAELCWRYGMGSEPICTLVCDRDSDCSAVGDTRCQPIRRGLSLCL
jgi:hypothetical protein